MQDAVNDIMQPSWNHAFVTFNNQNSVILRMDVEEYGLSCLLHDNRIFAFKRKASDDAPSSSNSDDASSLSDEQNMLLSLLTTPKYRAMSTMYIIFRLLDNIFFLSIIVLSIINGGLTLPTPANLALFSAIGLEVFYDVMMQTNKYWILERLSIYIGIVLYVAYYGVVVWKNSHGEYKPNDLNVVFAVLSIRFLAFVFEECVDIAIDGELHNDLLKLQKYKEKKQSKEPEDDPEPENDPEPESDPEPENDPEPEDVYTPLVKKHTYSLWSKFKIYMDVIAVKMPQNVDYRGSFFAWSPQSVFTEKVWTKDQFPRWLVYTLCFLPFIVASTLSMLLILLCLVASFIPIILFMLICAVITIKSVFTEMVRTGDQFPCWLEYILCFLRWLVYTLYFPPFVVAFILFLLLIILCLFALIIPLILLMPIYAVIAIHYRTCNPGRLKEKMMSSYFWKELIHFLEELAHF